MPSQFEGRPAIARTAVAGGLAALLLLFAGCRCGTRGRQAGEQPSFAWTHSDSGLAWGIRIDPANLRAGDTATVHVVLKNATEAGLFVPRPDAGTVTVRLGDGGIVAAHPGRPDRWVELAAGETLAWSTGVSWATPGTYRVAAVLAAHDAARGLAPLTTPAVAVVVRAGAE